jgi:hypothetical protein
MTSASCVGTRRWHGASADRMSTSYRRTTSPRWFTSWRSIRSNSRCRTRICARLSPRRAGKRSASRALRSSSRIAPLEARVDRMPGWHLISISSGPLRPRFGDARNLRDQSRFSRIRNQGRRGTGCNRPLPSSSRVTLETELRTFPPIVSRVPSFLSTTRSQWALALRRLQALA